MYNYTFPHPIIIDLGYSSTTKDQGFKYRLEAYEYVKNNRSQGAQAANDDRQGYGILAEMVVRTKLGLPSIDKSHPITYDIKSKHGVKIDIKCRGGEKNFEEGYLGDDGFLREAKHNLFARQLFDQSLDCDIFLLTHLRRPLKRANLPGTVKEKSWKLYICGWISKKRALKEAVYIPPGGISEQGRSWLSYRYQNMEVFNKTLNGFERIEDISELELKDVIKDEDKTMDLHMTGVDAYRIISDLIGRGIIKKGALSFVKRKFNLTDKVKPLLHPNQYFHLLLWLKENNQISNREINRLKEIFTEEKFEGL